jgi:hypothetical protein
MGRRVFEDAVSSAESLIRVVDAPGVEDVFFEEFRYVPARAYEALTGCGFPPHAGARQVSKDLFAAPCRCVSRGSAEPNSWPLPG